MSACLRQDACLTNNFLCTTRGGGVGGWAMVLFTRGPEFDPRRRRCLSTSHVLSGLSGVVGPPAYAAPQVYSSGCRPCGGFLSLACQCHGPHGMSNHSWQLPA